MLAHRNVDIGLWHTLAINPQTGGPYLSSRRLLVLLDKLPDDSEFKKVSERNGRQSRQERVAEDLHNEIAWLRSSYYAVNGGKDAIYEPRIYRDPIDEKALAELKAEEDALAAQGVEEFNAQIGFS
ncbi:MAG: hypothetical protein WBB07_17640 [Mycobacterium sp.]